MGRSRWDRKYIELAQTTASWSKDRSTPVGCVLVNPVTNVVVSLGYNGFPRLVADGVEERHARPLKYLYTEHAERNAIYNAARSGHATEGCTAYLNWAPGVCADCARALIQAGIRRVVGPNVPFPGKGDHWYVHETVVKLMFTEANIEVVVLGE